MVCFFLLAAMCNHVLVLFPFFSRRFFQVVKCACYFANAQSIKNMVSILTTHISSETSGSLGTRATPEAINFCITMGIQIEALSDFYQKWVFLFETELNNGKFAINFQLTLVKQTVKLVWNRKAAFIVRNGKGITRCFLVGQCISFLTHTTWFMFSFSVSDDIVSIFGKLFCSFNSMFKIYTTQRLRECWLARMRRRV